jgi:hypothetical protein
MKKIFPYLLSLVREVWDYIRQRKKEKTTKTDKPALPAVPLLPVIPVIPEKNAMSIEELIYSTAVQDGMPSLLAQFIVAQSKHETGNYKHRFFTTGKNAFGYSYVKGGRWQLDKGGPLADNGVPIAQYSSVSNSVHELTDWIKRRQRDGQFPKDLRDIKNAEDYAMLLRYAGYFTAPLSAYAAGMVYWLKKLPPLVVAGAGIGFIALIAALIVFRKDIGL